MKLNDVKHNHSLTDLLKILIFSILMLIPFIDVGIRCAYVVCNKNAYQSYYGETINEKEYNYLTFNQLEENNTYYLTNSINTQFNTEAYQDTYILVQDCYVDGQYIENCNRLRFYYTNTYITFQAYNGTTYLGQLWSLYNDSHTYEFIYKGYLGNSSYFSILGNEFYTLSYNQYSYLDNVFDYSVNKLSTSELYTWTQNTAIYTGVQTMTTQLGINNTIIPILLVYWFILIIIYIIIDILLNLFKVLTHIIGSKTV